MQHRSSSTGRSKPSRTRELAHSHSRPCHHILTHARACLTCPPSKARPLERTVGCVCVRARQRAHIVRHIASPVAVARTLGRFPHAATAITLTVFHTPLAATTKRPVSPHVVVARCGCQVDALVISSVCYMRRRLSRQLHRIHVLYRHFTISKHLVCPATRRKLDSDVSTFPQNFVHIVHWHAAEFNLRAIEVALHDFRRITGMVHAPGGCYRAIQRGRARHLGNLKP